MHMCGRHLYLYNKARNYEPRFWTSSSTISLYRSYLEEDKDKEGFLVLAPLTFMGWDENVPE